MKAMVQSATSAAAPVPAAKPVRISAFILTRNEERNIESCLQSLAGWCTDIHIVDSFSTDRTLEIAALHGAHIHQNRFEGHTMQRAWALRNVPFANEWVLALDADHRVMDDLREELIARFAEPPEDFDGFFICRRQIFRGKWIRFGGYYPKYQLKLFRRDRAFLDDNEFDYRFYVNGRTAKLKHDIVESNENEWGISFFIEKHNRFATELATEEIKRAHGRLEYLSTTSFFGNPDQRILWLKLRWNTLPRFVRPFLLFFYRYFLCLGFLDGKEGFIFHFLQSLWFRLLVDIRREELEAQSDASRKPS
ncbi:MAG TPA: glycosyltransferase family 2 protein [Bryobacteraceae bacterium]|nr:glycosyltransferase family 2 protein [Bryobacteraceae bacterium]